MIHTSLQRIIVTAALALTAAAAIALGAGGAFAQADEEPVPVVRVQPVYPARAISRGETGAVALRFTITADGRTKNIEVVESTARTFEQPAIDALRKRRYERQSAERQCRRSCVFRSRARRGCCRASKRAARRAAALLMTGLGPA